MTKAETLLCTMLHCGSADLELLDDIEYDWDEVLDQMDWPCNGGFNDLMRAVFNVGLINIADAVRNRIYELEGMGELSKEEISEQEALRRLNPDNDFSTYCNCLDTHVYCERHGDVYRKYMQDALDAFEHDAGFYIVFI